MPAGRIYEPDLEKNPTPRVPVCLCLDVSLSMSGKEEWGAAPGIKGVPIDELNTGLEVFYEEVKKDPRSRYAAEVAVVSFSHSIFPVQDFVPILDAEPPVLELDQDGTGTHLGKAVEFCLDLLQERDQKYARAGVDRYQPWLIVMTDGRPTDASHRVVAGQVSDLVNKKKLMVLAVGIGDKADLDVLGSFSPEYPAFKLKGLRFGEFFRLVSVKIQQVSRSRHDEEFKFNPRGAQGWDELLRR